MKIKTHEKRDSSKLFVKLMLVRYLQSIWCIKTELRLRYAFKNHKMLFTMWEIKKSIFFSPTTIYIGEKNAFDIIDKGMGPYIVYDPKMFYTSKWIWVLNYHSHQEVHNVKSTNLSEMAFNPKILD